MTYIGFYTLLTKRITCFFICHKFTIFDGQGRGMDKPVWQTKTCGRCNVVRSDY